MALFFLGDTLGQGFEHVCPWGLSHLNDLAALRPQPCLALLSFTLLLILTVAHGRLCTH